MSASWQRFLGLMVGSASVVAGCSSAKKIEVGGTCILNSDCNSSLVCTLGKCHDECHTSADCPAGQSCIIASDQSKVCQLPVETHCTYNSDCQTPLVCAADLRCRNQCQTSVDCSPGQTCTTTKTCAEPSQVDSNNNLFLPDGGVSGSGGASGAGGSGGGGGGAEAGVSDASGAAPDVSMGGADAPLGSTSTDVGNLAVDTRAGATGGASGTTGAGDTAGLGGRDGSATCTDASAATIGAPGTCCVEEGATGCSANASPVQVVCVNGSWASNGTCPSGRLCDTTPGFAAGSCQNVVAECSGKNPGDGVCKGQTAETCGPDLVSATPVQTCVNQACVNGACKGECTPGQKTCVGNTPQLCSDTGLAQPQTSCSGATPYCTAGACTASPGSGGPAMVLLPLGYYIDSTEVTQAQYVAWLYTNPSTVGQIPACSWNTSFVPSSNWPPTGATLNDPVVYVNWCDAYAYCAGVGKRLCGKVGGGSNGYNDYATVLSQWFAACSSNGTNASGYPYGNTYDPKACNGADYWNSVDAGTASVLPVASLNTCQSSVTGYTGVYDLSGNVGEWEDSCSGTAGNADECRVRGGYFGNAGGYLACYSVDNEVRRWAYGNLGFRCCAP